MRRALLAAVVLSLLAAAPAVAAPALTSVGSFERPVHVAAPAGDARLFVVEKAGRVQVVANGQRSVFLDATGVVKSSGEEQGLLSIAFAPDYAASGLFYVFYTDAGNDLVVREGTRTADPNRGQLGRILFTIAHDQAENHNGGQLAFGPDGALYASTGDGGTQGDPEGDAQNPASLLGKILRIDVRAGGGPQVWALGLRNPWRFSFDRATGDMVIGDVGWSDNEEIDFAPNGASAGRNYGWPQCEGSAGTCPGAAGPVLNLPRGSGYSGVIGGVVVRDPALPTLAGRYVFGDLTKDTVLSAALNSETTPKPETNLRVSFPTSFGEDGCGHVYVAVDAGPVYRLHDGPATACPATTGPGGGGTTNPNADSRPCTLTVRRARRAQRIVRRGKRLRVTLRSDEDCRATLRARRFRTKQVQLRANARRLVRLKPTKKGLRRLRRAVASSDRHQVRVTVRIRTRDAAGNRGAARVRPRVR